MEKQMMQNQLRWAITLLTQPEGRDLYQHITDMLNEPKPQHVTVSPVTREEVKDLVLNLFLAPSMVEDTPLYDRVSRTLVSQLMVKESL